MERRKKYYVDLCAQQNTIAISICYNLKILLFKEMAYNHKSFLKLNVKYFIIIINFFETRK